jgi:hypothetical protein
MPSVIDDDVENVLFHFLSKICEDYSKKNFPGLANQTLKEIYSLFIVS